MRLISVQSRGDRLVRVVYQRPDIFSVVKKEFRYGVVAGAVTKTFPIMSQTTEFLALKAAEEWLEGATV